MDPCSTPDHAAPALSLAYMMPAFLEMITQYLSGYDIMALYFTCSKALMTRIRAGGTKQFNIGAGDVPTWSANAWGVLRQLPRLETIKIQSSALKVWQEGPELLTWFPPTIRTIALCPPTFFSLWLSKQHKNDRRYTKFYKALQEHPNEVLQNVEEKRLELPPCLCISTLFPQLENFEAIGGVSYYRGLGWESPKNEAGHVVMALFLRQFPSSLRSLRLPDFQTTVWRSVSYLPSNLHCLSIYNRDNLNADCNEDFEFPSELVHLELDVTGAIATPYLFANLSSTLESLEVWSGKHFDASVLQPLLNHPLTQLKLNINRVERILRFPPMLTVLELKTEFINLREQLHFCDLPRSLTKLILSASSTWSTYAPFGDYEALPHNLQHFEFGPNILISDSDICKLPANLTHVKLDIARICFANHVDDSRCSQTCVSYGALHPELLYQLSPNSSFDLFDALTYLELLNVEFSEQFYQTLPYSLTTLKISYVRNALSSTAFMALPANLKTLHIGLDHLIDLNGFESLPNSLTDLRIDTKQPSFKDSHLTHLPPNLLSLEVDPAQELTDAFVITLPRTLTFIKLTDARKLTANCLQHLPRTLRTLNVPCIIMPNVRPTRAQLIEMAPPALQIFELNWQNTKRRRVNAAHLQ